MFTTLQIPVAFGATKPQAVAFKLRSAKRQKKTEKNICLTCIVERDFVGSGCELTGLDGCRGETPVVGIVRIKGAEPVQASQAIQMV